MLRLPGSLTGRKPKVAFLMICTNNTGKEHNTIQVRNPPVETIAMDPTLVRLPGERKFKRPLQHAH